MKPRDFATRMSSAEQLRTWATVPGAESRLSRYSVWMESITTTSGASGRLEARDDVAQ